VRGGPTRGVRRTPGPNERPANAPAFHLWNIAASVFMAHVIDRDRERTVRGGSISPLVPMRSPVAGIAWPLCEIRASTVTLPALDKLRPGIIDWESSSVNATGHLETLRRITATGARGRRRLGDDEQRGGGRCFGAERGRQHHFAAHDAAQDAARRDGVGGRRNCRLGIRGGGNRCARASAPGPEAREIHRT